MAKTQAHRRNGKPFLEKWAIRCLIVAFVAIKAIVPPGFMPSTTDTSGLFKLCHGDSHSAQILSLLESHQEIPSSPSKHGNECSFSQFSSLLLLTANINLSHIIDNQSASWPLPANNHRQSSLARLNQARAPPYGLV